MSNWDSEFFGAILSRTTPSKALETALTERLPKAVRLSVAEVKGALDASLVRARLSRCFPEEALLVERAVPKRLLEFVAARTVARELLAEFGVEPTAITRGPLGAPLWPAGYVGSITHSAGMVAVIVASLADYRALGLDLEPNEPLPEDVTDYICLPGELEQAPQSRAVFAAKEAFYKAHCTLHHRMLDFAEVRVTFGAPSWKATELRPPEGAIGPTTIEGSIVTTAGWLAAFCSVTAT